MNGIEQYKNVHTSSASPHKLVQMLLDTFIERTEQAIDAIKHDKIELKSLAVSKAISILGILEESLDLDAGGELAERLKSLYQYTKSTMLAASVSNDVIALEHTKSLIAEIQQAWVEIGNNGSASTE